MIKKHFLLYLTSSVIRYLFQLAYHHFSHGVSSPSLSYAWMISMIGGCLLTFLTRITPSNTTRVVRNLANSSLAVFTSWALLTGILAIASSDSPYLDLYLYVGNGLLLFSCLAYLHRFSKQKKESHNT